jgi:aromatic ring-cleaving dioxygenase
MSPTRRTEAPGVQIDASQRKIGPEKWKTEFDRPIYFVDFRTGYVCSWCQVDRDQLIVIPHPHSYQNVRRFDYPSEAEIVGRVTGWRRELLQKKHRNKGSRRVRPS